MGNAYLLWVAPGLLDWRPKSWPRVDKRGERGRQVVKSRLLMLIVGWRSDRVDHSRDYFF
jgi:hypothetical protein